MSGVIFRPQPINEQIKLRKFNPAVVKWTWWQCRKCWGLCLLNTWFWMNAYDQNTLECVSEDTLCRFIYLFIYLFIDWLTDWLTDGRTDGLTNGRTDWLVVGLIDLMNDLSIDRSIDWLIDWLFDWMIAVWWNTSILGFRIQNMISLYKMKSSKILKFVCTFRGTLSSFGIFQTCLWFACFFLSEEKQSGNKSRNPVWGFFFWK